MLYIYHSRNVRPIWVVLLIFGDKMSETNTVKWILIYVNVTGLSILILMVIVYILIFLCVNKNENYGQNSGKCGCKPDRVIGFSLIVSILYTLSVFYKDNILGYIFQLNIIRFNITCLGYQLCTLRVHISFNITCVMCPLYIYIYIVTGLVILQRFIVYSFDVRKLRITFRDSVYEIKNCVLASLYIILVVSCLGYYIAIYFVNNVRTFFGESYCDHNIRYIRTIFIAFGTLDILFAFVFTRMITTRLLLVLDIKYFSKLKSVHQRLKVLGIISILSSFIFILASQLNPYIKPYKILCIDLVINNGCLMASFGKTISVFNSYCKCSCKTKENTKNSVTPQQSPQPPEPHQPTHIPTHQRTKITELQLAEHIRTSNHNPTLTMDNINSPKTLTQTIRSLNIPSANDGDLTQTSQNDPSIPDVLDMTLKKQKSHDPQTSLSDFINNFNAKKSPTQHHPNQDSTTIIYGNNSSTEFNINNLTLDLNYTNHSNTIFDKTPKVCSFNLRELGIII